MLFWLVRLIPVLQSYTPTNHLIFFWVPFASHWCHHNPGRVLAPVMWAVHISHAMESPDIALNYALISTKSSLFSYLLWGGDTFRAVMVAVIKIQIQRYLGWHLVRVIEYNTSSRFPCHWGTVAHRSFCTSGCIVLLCPRSLPRLCNCFVVIKADAIQYGCACSQVYCFWNLCICLPHGVCAFPVPPQCACAEEGACACCACCSCLFSIPVFRAKGICAGTLGEDPAEHHSCIHGVGFAGSQPASSVLAGFPMPVCGVFCGHKG